MATTDAISRSSKSDPTAEEAARPRRSSNGASDRLATVGNRVSEAAVAVATAAGDAATRVPVVVDRSRVALDDANRMIREGSDETLSTGTALSFGFAFGLLVGGANRMLVAAALIPAGMLGLALFERLAVRSAPRSTATNAGL